MILKPYVIGFVVIAIALTFGQLFSQSDCSLQQKLVAKGSQSDDQFGTSIDIHQDFLIIGAKFTDVAGNQDSGVAYIFHKSEDWAQVAKLSAADAQANAWFGNAVAIGSGFALVGSPFYASSKGAVYIFEVPPSGWQDTAENRKLTGEADGDQFGISMAVSEDLLIVGAPKKGEGVAYIYKRECQQGSCDWQLVQRLQSSHTGSSDNFGSNVDIDSQSAIVGAWNQPSKGAAYIFMNTASTWIETAKLHDMLSPSELQNGGEFGFGVAIFGTLALVSDNKDYLNGHEHVGSAYLFELDSATSTWSKVAHLTPSVPVADEEFGSGAVALAKEIAVIGATKNGLLRGSVFLYKKPSNGWHDMTETQELIEATAVDDRYGNPVVTDGLSLAVGSAHDDDVGMDTGAVYVYSCIKHPICDAGISQTVDCSSSSLTSFHIQLDGTRSSDPEGGPVSYNWTLENCSGASLDNPDTATPVLVLETSDCSEKTCTINLTVTDPDGLSSTCSTEASIRDTRPAAVVRLEKIDELSAMLVLETTIATIGGEVGVSFQKAVLKPSSISKAQNFPSGATLYDDLAPDYPCLEAATDDTGVVAGWTMALSEQSQEILPPGTYRLLVFHFTAADSLNPRDCSELHFVDCLGVSTAPIRNIVTTENGQSIDLIVAPDNVQLCRPPSQGFRRGDSNEDANVDISDAVFSLSYLFLGGPTPTCLDAADANDDGRVDLSDAVYTLGFKFLGGPEIPAPGPNNCGKDPTTDSLVECSYNKC